MNKKLANLFLVLVNSSENTIYFLLYHNLIYVQFIITIQVVTPRTFSLVCFRLVPLASDQDNGRKLNYDLMDAANSSGKIFISHTVGL